MKYAPQIASIERNILTQTEVPSVCHGNEVAEWAWGLTTKKEFLETNRVIHDLILSVDDEDALGDSVFPDERMKIALLRNQRC